MSLRIDILTLFPEMFGPFLTTSIPGRAAEKGLVEYRLTDLRTFGKGPHRKVDDRPFGGGPGMVLSAPVVVEAVESVEAEDARPATRLLMSPQGRVLDQAFAEELAGRERLLLIAGRYEGFDQRISDVLEPVEVSIGDYVLSGGELAAMVVVDAVVRLRPGGAGGRAGAGPTSRLPAGCWSSRNTPARRLYRGLEVPAILTGGDHGAVAEWRQEQRELRTKQRRPDLWAKFESESK